MNIEISDGDYTVVSQGGSVGILVGGRCPALEREAVTGPVAMVSPPWSMKVSQGIENLHGIIMIVILVVLIGLRIRQRPPNSKGVGKRFGFGFFGIQSDSFKKINIPPIGNEKNHG